MAGERIPGRRERRPDGRLGSDRASFTDAEGAPLPEYFHPRPSAAGDGYDGGASSGSNYGPENSDLITAIEERQAEIAAFEGVDVSEIPADAVTASASGLDPHISPAYGLLQVDRVAEARGLDVQTVLDLVESRIQARDLGFLGNRGSTCWSSTSRSTPSRADSDSGRIDR